MSGGNRICSVADCNRPYRAKGLCHAHYCRKYLEDKEHRKRKYASNEKWRQAHRDELNAKKRVQGGYGSKQFRAIRKQAMMRIRQEVYGND